MRSCSSLLSPVSYHTSFWRRRCLKKDSRLSLTSCGSGTALAPTVASSPRLTMKFCSGRPRASRSRRGGIRSWGCGRWTACSGRESSSRRIRTTPGYSLARQDARFQKARPISACMSSSCRSCRSASQIGSRSAAELRSSSVSMTRASIVHSG